ncbi:Toxic anion resistance protein (TelA) [compost metagenome]
MSQTATAPQTVLAPVAAAPAPFILTPPELVQPVTPVAVAASQPTQLTPDMTQRLDQQVDAFVQALSTADLASDEFRNKLDMAFALGRREIAEATTLSNSFTRKKYVGEKDSNAYKAISDIRTLFDELNPAKQGDLLSPTKVLGIPVPWGNKLQQYLRRYESADKQLTAIYEHVVSARDEVAQGVSELGLAQQKFWSALQPLESATYFLTRLDERLRAEVEAVRLTQPERARALESEVLYYVDQNLGDIGAARALTINSYLVAGELRKTGRETMIGCDRVSTLGMAALSLAVFIARQTGVQIKVNQMLVGAKQSVESLVASTGTALQEHVKATTEFASNPLLGLQSLQNMFDQTFAAIEVMENFRSQALETMGENNRMLNSQLDSYTARIQQDRKAAALASNLNLTPEAGAAA